MITYGFSGHETFTLRHGWLKKGLDGVLHQANFFSGDDAMVKLGVGKNMVRSIRHWCLATGVIDVAPHGGPGVLVTTDFGERVFSSDGGLDPFLEDFGTLWLLHWHLATNAIHSATWYWMFSHCNHSEVTKESVFSDIQPWMERGGKRAVSDNTLLRDIDCFFRTYAGVRSPRSNLSEDLLDCPFVELSLLKDLDGGRTFGFERESRPTLSNEVFLYCLGEFWLRGDRSDSISVPKLLSEPGSPARVFRLEENALTRRLEFIGEQSKGVFVYDETAGLKQLFKRGDIDLSRWLKRCYRSGVGR